MAAAFGVEIGLVQVRAQQHQQRPVMLGKVGSGPAEEEQPHGPARPAGLAGCCGQGQHQIVLVSPRPVHTGDPYIGTSPVVPAPATAVHVISTGMPGWQITLIAIGAALLAATVAVRLDRARATHRNTVTTAT